MSSHVSYVLWSRFVLLAPACQATETSGTGHLSMGHCDGANLLGTVMGQLIYGDTLMGHLIYGASNLCAYYDRELIYICTLMGTTILWGGIILGATDVWGHWFPYQSSVAL